MTYSIHLTEEEMRLATSYAKIHSVPVEEAFKQALFERIEDEYDEEIAREAIAEYEASGRQSRPIYELWEECGL